MHSPQTIYLKDYCAPDFLIDTVDLFFQLQEDVTEITSHMVLRRHPEAARSSALILAGEDLALVSVKLDDVLLSPPAYEVSADKLVILDAPETFHLEIVTRIKPQENTLLSGLYQSNGNYCTQCEAHGFRRMTYFLDRPDVLAC